MRIQLIRNATMKIACGGVTLLLDPWLENRGTGMSARTVRPEMMGVKSPLCDLPMTPQDVLSGVDYCLVTHVHPDHFTTAHMPPDIPVIVSSERDLALVRQMGFVNARAIDGSVMRIGDSENGIEIEKTPAIHGDNEEIARRMGEGVGYLIRGEGKTLYIAGDTVFFGGVADVIKGNALDAIAVNCCAATVPLGRLIMDLADVEQVCALCPGAPVLAVHMDNVNHALLTRADVRAFAAEKGLANIVVPEDGEVIGI